MAYQFIHIETYSEQPKSVKGSKDHFNCAAQVEGEASRDPIYSEHVENPLPPKQLHGTLTIAEFREKRARLLAGITETVTLKNGNTYNRGLRKDAATLYTEIHSHPLTSAEFLADQDAHRDSLNTWGVRVLADFQTRMPDGIDFTSVLHLDEGHVHIHILAMNTADPKLDANKLHAGKVAAARHREENASDAIVSMPKPDLAKRPKKPKKPRPSKNRTTQKKNDAHHAVAVATWEAECEEINVCNAALTTEWTAQNKVHLNEARKERGRPAVNKVYVNAMKKLQDDYYKFVGKPCGLLRIGPRLARKSTKEYAAEKKQAKRMAKEAAQLERHRKEQAIREAELRARANQLASAETDLVQREALHETETEAANKALEKERASLRGTKLEVKKAQEIRVKKLVEKENKLSHREAELTEAVEAMAEIFEAVETGEAEIVDGKLKIPQWPDIVSRMAGAGRAEVSSPIRKLIKGFTRLVVKLSKRTQDSHAPEMQDDRPELGG
ncbi:Mob protein [uncultured Sulfitobacter sp.]|uniref:Mob protein n=1 Tax=uncultured Sulfitobacter sp. TaxID=191468 RepID=UPI0026282D3E|nr:Mob protein [uncultured Sulfitobacter sp.]